MDEVRATGLDAVGLATRLLQRARVADPVYGLWEAADVQWWWRTPQRSDAVEKHFWVDGDGPAAALLVTEFRGTWQVDPIVAPGSGLLGAVWERALEALAALSPDPAEIPVRDDDDALLALVREAGLVPGPTSGVVRLDAAERPQVPLPDGFVLVDRVDSPRPHPMRGRNGAAVEERLRQCSLYDRGLDLAVETSDGEVAGYSLYWFDPVTKVGLLEPMRVEGAFQRLGLARAMIAAGLERLAVRGAERTKVGYSHDGARSLYTGAGFRSPATSTWFGQLPTAR
jgi:predicted N-acetyltransferase YhbS